MSDLPIQGLGGRTFVSAETRKTSGDWDGETNGCIDIQIVVDCDVDGRDEVELTINGTVYSIMLADLLGALGKELDK